MGCRCAPIFFFSFASIRFEKVPEEEPKIGRTQSEEDLALSKRIEEMLGPDAAQKFAGHTL
jgi:hypothetical protein